MNTHRLACLTSLLLSTCCALSAADEPPIDPLPRACKPHVLHQWDFDSGTEGWVVESQCTLNAVDGVLRVKSMGDDPFFHQVVDFPGGQVVVELRMRSRGPTAGSVFWTSDRHPLRGEDKRSDFPMPDDGQWTVTQTRFTAPGRLTDLRIDPGTLPGLVEIDWIRLIQEELHPLTVSRVSQESDAVQFEVTNHQEQAVQFITAGQTIMLAGNEKVVLTRPTLGQKPLESVTLSLACDTWPVLDRTAWVVHPDVATDWLVRPVGTAEMLLARDGSVALLRQNGQLVATIGPLVTVEGKLPALKLVEEASSIRLAGEEVTVGISLSDQEIEIVIDGSRAIEGPVVRVRGGLEQGLFAGLEYLGKGERSSSRLDIETPEHIRFAPDPLKVTLPLMAFVTEHASIAMTWDDMTLQPVYATPNFFDGVADHRMTLQGKTIRATIRVASDPLEEAIAWAVTRRGLPDLPPAPRTREQQQTICLKALHGPLRTDEGWGHCAQDSWPRRPFADMASTLWRLGADIPAFDEYIPGGAHVANGTMYFVTGQTRQWLEFQRRQVRNYINTQQADGSYRYRGEYARGHFEDTASGICALPAARLLEFAYVTGDDEALQAGLRTLDYMKRFRTPRGAQVWECALHTPDQLASAYLVWAYARGYELTGRQDYLQQARKWALSGIPFTYLWSRYPMMLYATPPVYGATNWVAPNWMGRPVQWVGLVYAYALTRLAPHEDSLDWNHLARGILISAQQQQYPDGPHVGLLPDALDIRSQRRQPADINPCAIVSLQMVLDGEVDFLSVARGDGAVVAAPFPVTIRDGAAHVQAKAGVTYQLLIDGRQVVDVVSQGTDVVPLQ